MENSTGKDVMKLLLSTQVLLRKYFDPPWFALCVVFNIILYLQLLCLDLVLFLTLVAINEQLFGY